jgi:DNA-binding response OmpR family regulator
MQLKALALGDKNVTQRIATSLYGSEIDVVCFSDVMPVLAVLNQEKFDIALVDSNLKNIESVCYRISMTCLTPVALIINSAKTDWAKFSLLDVDGFVTDGCSSTELMAQVRAIVRRNKHPVARAKILVIEDDEQIREALSISFRIFWPEAIIYSADSGLGGIEFAKHESMDAILLDLGLPDISGFEVLNQIRSFSLTPVIMLTAARDEEVVVKALKSGADDYMIKPFKQAELMSRIKSHIDLSSNLN